MVNLQSEAPEGHVLKVRALLLTKEWDAAIAAAHTAAEAHRGDRSVMEVIDFAERLKPFKYLPIFHQFSSKSLHFSL